MSTKMYTAHDATSQIQFDVAAATMTTANLEFKIEEKEKQTHEIFQI